MNRRLIWVLGPLLSACVLHKGIDKPVRSVKVEGNKALSDKAIVERLATRPPQGLIIRQAQELDPIAVELDRRRIESFYKERGYYDAHVDDVHMRPVKGGVGVTFTVVEGEPTRVASLEVTGTDTDLARGVILKKTAVRAGRVFDHEDYLIAKDALQQALLQAGYAHAKVEGVVEVDRPKHSAVVRLTAMPGPLVHFGKTHVEGNHRVPSDAVLNRVSWGEGDVFSPAEIAQTEGRLYQLGVFSSVRTDWPREGQPEVVDITIKVAEGARHEVRLGFGAGVDRARWEVRTRAGYTVHRFFDSPLTTMRFDVTPGYSWLRSDGSSGPSVEAIASLDRDDLIFPRLKGTALTAYQREPREGYILSGPRVNLSLDRPFFPDDSLVAHVGWELRLLDFIDADPMLFGPAATRARLAYYEQRLVLDKRDAPLDAHRGFYAAIQLNEGGPAAGGSETFIKTTGDVRGYLPVLWDRLVFAARLSGGRMRASGAETPLPLRFYGGGATDHRGFSFRRLAPFRMTADGKAVPIGGDDQLLASLETRLDLFRLKKEWFSGALFFDAGDVTAAPDSIELGHLHYAVGLGVRYNTVIGPIRADVGMRLNRMGATDPDPSSRFAFHLSLGEAF